MRWSAGLFLCLALVVTSLTLTVAQPQPAKALDGSSFDPGYIISDAQFYAGDAMTEAEIQAFLNAHGPASCLTGYTCLKDSSFPTYDKAANPMCKAYTGAASESVARIISKVGLACGISPRVLLVMLQKEQGLITDNWPTQGQLNAAMGAGCPDTAACDPALAGFFTQVYYAAYYLIRYGGPPGTGPGTPYNSDFSYYGPGKTVPIQYNPDTACGTQAVYIRNQPTASLYTYTPYVPNAAALANLNGIGDSCSAYGNRNFWVFYNNWFGDPTSGLLGVTVSRIAGADRYDVAVAISQKAYPTPGVPVVYVSTGVNYPDALSAAPAAALQGGPLLLSDPGGLPPAIRAEIVRLAPAKIVVVGGSMSVSDAVVADLGTIVGDTNVVRIGGADRYETSRNIVQYAFGTAGAKSAYIATGLNFPDALSASSAAGTKSIPVLLMRGSDTAVDAPTSDLLTSLGVTSIKVAGGPNSVSDALVASLNAIVPTTRISGADRFVTSYALAVDAFGSAHPTQMFIATGFNFPDALAGAVLAAKRAAPLVVVPSDCVPGYTTALVTTLGVTQVTLLGGTSALGTNVEYFAKC
jgi:putative cell wall-binding protein